MNLSIAGLIEIVLAAALRRKQLILWPIIFFSALAVLAVFFWPRSYATSALLMLQERQSSGSLSMDGSVSRQGRLNAEEIDTLLKSERVLTSAIIDMNVGGKPLKAEEIEGGIRSIRKRIGVSVVGSDFIQIEYKDSQREGISEQLSIIMTRFFERLLTRGDAMRTAREFALDQRQRDVMATRSAIEDWIVRAEAAGAASEPVDEKLSSLRQQRTEMDEKLKASAGVLLPGAAGLASLESAINDEIRMSSSRLSPANPLEPQSDRIEALSALGADAAALRKVDREISDLLKNRARDLAQSLKSSTTSQDQTTTALLSEWTGLEGRYSEAVDQYDSHMERSKKGSGPALTPFGLIAPDSIRIIDEPRDPELPTTSLLKILVACIGAGVGLGAGLAAMAEQFDDRIYDSRGLAKITGVDTVFRLPDAGENGSMDTEAEEQPPRRSRLSVVS